MDTTVIVILVLVGLLCLSSVVLGLIFDPLDIFSSDSASGSPSSSSEPDSSSSETPSSSSESASGSASNPMATTKMILEVPPDALPADHYVDISGTKVYEESDNAHYNVMNNCINECLANVDCHMATWYQNGTFGTTGKRCKFMHTSRFQNNPDIKKIDKEVYIPIKATQKNNIVRHFAKPIKTPLNRPYIHTDSSGNKFVVFKGITVDNVI